jgi:hypothetical protein
VILDPVIGSSYIRSVPEFAQHFNKPPDQLGAEEIRSGQLSSRRSAHPVFFYQNTLHRRIVTDRIPLPRYEKKLTVILSKAEVKALLETPKNLPHRVIPATMHGAGLRVSGCGGPESVRPGYRAAPAGSGFRPRGRAINPAADFQSAIPDTTPIPTRVLSTISHKHALRRGSPHCYTES